jgi:hypothetical protein
MPEEKEFTITIKCDADGHITLKDSRNEGEFLGQGILLTLGDHFKQKHAHFAWGNYQSITYGFYGGIMESRYDKSDTGEFYRTVFGTIARMIAHLHDSLKKRNQYTAEEVLERWESEDKEGGTVH